MRRSRFQARKLKEKIVKSKIESPWFSSRRLGHLFGVDHTWVLKVLKDSGVSTRLAPLPRKIRKKKNKIVFCKYCKSHLPQDRIKFQRYCDDKCKDLALFVFFTCPICSKIFKKKTTRVKVFKKRGYNNFFCGRPCYFEALRRKLIVANRQKEKKLIYKKLFTDFQER